MPVSESGVTSPVDQLNTVPSGRSPGTSSKVSRQDSSSKKQKSRETGGDEKLRRQMSRELSEDKIRRQMHKQESKDSGIVTEMYTRPKEYTQDSKGKKPSRSSSMKTSRTGSVKNKDKVENVSGSGDIETEDPNEIELLTPKQNGSVENDDQEKSSASIKTMWKKAFKSLKTSSAENKLTKKASFIKKKQRSKEDEAEPEPKHSGDIDPVYSLLKCAADLPKAGKSCGLHPHCSGHHGSLRLSNTSTTVADSSGSTSKTSSPSSSGMQEAVVNSLGSEFKNYYKLTSPMKKSASSPFDFF